MITKLTNKLHKLITKTVYRKEMVVVITLKLVMLLGLWMLFFSHPVDHKLINIQVVNHFMVKRYSG